MSVQSAMRFETTDLESAIEQIHLGTAIYTCRPEIDSLLDHLEWPKRGTRLLDPGAGSGSFVVAALARLDLADEDSDEAIRRVRGYEFHRGAAAAARIAVATHLKSRGWTAGTAASAATRIIEVRDFLTSPIPVGAWDVIAANPPYWRYANLPESYRTGFLAAVAPHARGDLLHAYLQRCHDVIAPGGRIGMVTSDRWLINAGSAELRRRIGATYRIERIERLRPESAFYRPKIRTKGSPARIHPVSIVLSTDERGRRLDSSPFRIETNPRCEGIPLSSIAMVSLAPWLGPDGIFTVTEAGDLPPECLIPCFGMREGRAAANGAVPTRTWAIATNRDDPPEAVLRHLDGNLERMPARGRQRLRWLPPEPFHGRLPMSEDAVLVPRVARTLEAMRLPAGHLPVNHDLIVSGRDSAKIIAMLTDERVRRQADAVSPMVDGGYRSYGARMLRSLSIPLDLVPETGS